MSSTIDPNWFQAKFIKEGPPKIRKNRKRTRQVILECDVCKKHFTAELYNAKRIKQRTCGHTCRASLAHGVPGGNEKHPLYKRWLSMTQRCNNPTSNNYKNYGARGISIHPDFSEFSKYVYYVTKLPDYSEDNLKHLQLDRRKNDLGYTYGNLRWVPCNINIVNQRKRSTSLTKYIGVSKTTTGCKWSARITYKGKRIWLGAFLTQEEALDARNSFIIENKLPHKLQHKY